MQVISVAGISVLVLGFLAVTSSSPAFGEEKAFTLKDAVEFATEHNGELHALREEKGVREAGKIKAGLFPNPVFELEGATGEATGSSGENRFFVGVSQEFVTMGKRKKRLLVAGREIEAYHGQLSNSARLLAEEVKTAFSGLLLAERKVELAEQSIALSNQLCDVARQRFDAGDIPELELNLARVELGRSEGKKLEAERDLYQAKYRLLSRMGLSSAEQVKFTGSLERKSTSQTLEQLKALARTNRPDVLALEAEKEKAEAEIDLALAERVPNITAGFGYQREDSVIVVAGSDVKTRDNLIALKISVPIPIFDRNRAGIDEARARKSSAETRRAFAKLTAEREVEAAYAGLTTAEKSLALYRNGIMPQLEENLKLVQEAYKLGEVGILSVIEEQKKYYDVNDSYLTALYARYIAEVKLEAAIGPELSTETDGGAK